MRSLRRGLFVVPLLLLTASVYSESTVAPGDNFTWSANTGWWNWRGDGASGVVFQKNFVSGSIWAANVGWINLGDGTPANGSAYGNDSVDDFGVNVAQNATHFLLSGYGYGANIGWVSFNVPGGDAPKIDKQTGLASGYLWSGNVGWIALDSALTDLDTGLKQDVGSLWMIY